MLREGHTHDCPRTEVHVWIPDRCTTQHTPDKHWDGNQKMTLSKEAGRMDTIDARTPDVRHSSLVFRSTLTLLADHRRIPSTLARWTPDSEYDIRQREALIRKYIPPMKVCHYECQPERRMVVYTDEMRNRGIAHQPYCFRKGHVILNSEKKKSMGSSKNNYAVGHLGLSYSLPVNTSSPGERPLPVQASPKWTPASYRQPDK